MIRFPQLSIAQSAVNRIFNIHADVQQRQQAAQQAAEDSSPTVPDSAAQGAQIDAALSSPVQPVDGEPELADAITLKGLV